MDTTPITNNEMRLIALEEGWSSAISLDKLRLKMLHEAVDWICELTDLPLMEVRQQIASGCGQKVKKNLNVINAVNTLIQADSAKK
jgi:hypothetical protein